MRTNRIELPPYPSDEDHAPLLVDLALAEVVFARDVADGDLVLGIADLFGRVEYHNDQYTARPQPFDPTCQCGGCNTYDAAEGPFVNLGDDNQWQVCDSMPAEWLVVIVRAAHLA
ncbi:hypothetical protein [Streptomyces sp.]|uniref:hypothetical protein n=1 Tax=Streptomyces sp. TaxID=1931 RepID=UPI002D4DBA2A|nr:hypothetical protein [Streptomyces sp.]HZF90422.1 hypothetical protein [Streptomyces sp.]